MGRSIFFSRKKMKFLCKNVPDLMKMRFVFFVIFVGKMSKKKSKTLTKLAYSVG